MRKEISEGTEVGGIKEIATTVEKLGVLLGEYPPARVANIAINPKTGDAKVFTATDKFFERRAKKIIQTPELRGYTFFRYFCSVPGGNYAGCEVSNEAAVGSKSFITAVMAISNWLSSHKETEAMFAYQGDATILLGRIAKGNIAFRPLAIKDVPATAIRLRTRDGSTEFFAAANETLYYVTVQEGVETNLEWQPVFTASHEIKSASKIGKANLLSLNFGNEGSETVDVTETTLKNLKVDNFAKFIGGNTAITGVFALLNSGGKKGEEGDYFLVNNRYQNPTSEITVVPTEDMPKPYRRAATLELRARSVNA